MKSLLMIGWFLAGPITFLISVVDVWGSNSSLLAKILLSVFICPIIGAVWPGTWLIWLFSYAIGWQSPIRSVLGL